MKKKKLYPNFWKTSDNSKISCKEKIIILNNNVIELQNLINQIYVEVLADNYSSNRLFKKLRFVKSGCKKKWFRKEEEYVDLNIYQYFFS